MKTKTRPWRHIYYDIGIPRPKATTSSFQNQKTVTSRFGDKNTTRLKRGTWNLDVVAFCPLKKRLGITMLWLICLFFRCRGDLVPESRCRSFSVLESRSICAPTASFSLSS